jgi:hypothetical protein
MAGKNAFDEFDTVTTPTVEVTPTEKATNPFDEFSPTIQASVESIRPVEAPSLLQQVNPVNSPLYKEFMAPTDPKAFNVNNVLLGTGVGVGIGAFGGPVGAVVGGLEGGISSIGGEIQRQRGASVAEQLGTEAILGGVVQAAWKWGAKKALGLLPLKTRTVTNELVNDIPKEEEAIYLAKQKQFGPSKMESLYSTKNIDETQNILRGQYGASGIDIPVDRNVSDFLRDKLYSNLKTLKSDVITSTEKIPAQYDSFGLQTAAEKVITKSKPNVFYNSPEFKDLLNDLQDLKQRKLVNQSDITNTVDKLKNELSPRPGVVKESQSDLINLIQNGGTFSPKEDLTKVSSLINKTTQDALRTRFNQYLERNLGSQEYNILKTVENKEFIAEARDSIPTILTTRFTYLDKPYKDALDNIAQSPEGQAEFVKAVDQHFFNLGKSSMVNGKKVGLEVDADKLMKEFIRLRPAIEKSGVMTREQLVDLTTRINGLPKEIDKVIDLKNRVDLLRGTIIGVAAGQLPTTREKALIMPF